jgi:predicted transcriptional regulator
MARKPSKLMESVSVRLSPETRAALDVIAEETQRSLSWTINSALTEWLADRQRREGKAGPGRRDRG